MTVAVVVLPSLVVAYLVGAVPFGYLVARWRGVDIRTQGSGNIGATNVGRVLGRRYFFLVFVLDFAKGALPVLAARLCASSFALPVPAQTLEVLTGVAAFLGHLFPIYLGFRGGKGVATGAGVVAVLVPIPTLGAFLLWLAVFVASRYVALASLVAAVAVFGFRFPWLADAWDRDHIVATLFCLVASCLIILRHHQNIRRLLDGSENRFSETPAMLLLSKTLHVLAMGLWFGTVVFFTFVVGLGLLTTFESTATRTAEERPAWLPMWKYGEGKGLGEGFPDPKQKEQGTRAFGVGVSALFPWYYGIQTGCALFALATAFSWASRSGKVHRLRVLVLVLATVTVAVGWWLEHEVSVLRDKRTEAMNTVLQSATPSKEALAEARQLRADFGRWHGYSLLNNFAALLLVAVGQGLVAGLPARSRSTSPATSGSDQDKALSNPDTPEASP